MKGANCCQTQRRTSRIGQSKMSEVDRKIKKIDFLKTVGSNPDRWIKDIGRA